MSITTRTILVAAVLALGSATFATPASALTTAYTNDFSTAVGSEWTGFTTLDTTPNGACAECGSFLGPAGQVTSTLTLASLPAHTSVTVTWDLFILQSWDGEGSAGPDSWRLEADDTLVFDHTFGIAQSPQSYPTPGSPARTGSDATDTLGYSFYGDDVYFLSVTFPHSASSLMLDFIGAASQGWTDEGWGIDDVRVETDGTTELVCPHSHGHWKKAGNWPEGVESLTLGGHEYTQAQAISILKTAVGSGKKADASFILAYQLIATNLSVAAGSDASVVQDEIDNATWIFQQLGRIPTETRPNSAMGKNMTQNASKLDQYVNGLLTEGCHTDVSIEKTGPEAAANDTTVAFTINVTNLAHVEAKDVIVTDTLPAGWTYVSSTGPCVANGSTVTCDLGDMDALESVEFTISATAIGCGEATNTASVESSSEPAGHDENNSDDATVTVTDCIVPE